MFYSLLPNSKTLIYKYSVISGRFAEHPAIIEPFRNPAYSDEICDCILKLLEVKAFLRREAKANKTKLH